MKVEILNNLRKAILEYNPEDAKKWASKAIDEKTDPLIIMDALVDTIRQVGDGFATGEFFLPDLVGAADALQNATPVVEEAIKSSGKKRESLGTVIIGTVFGDIHTIGKSMVTSLLTAEGFEVHDIGINVPTERFVEAIETFKADILGMSALLTTTAPEAREVIKTLEKEKMRNHIKVMVGGGAITEAFATSIGADGYEATAPGAAKLARILRGL